MDVEDIPNPSEFQEELNDEKRCINSIREWILSIEKLNGRTDDEFILKFLRCAKYDLEKAKKRILKYYHARRAASEFWTSRNSKAENVKVILESSLLSELGRHLNNGSHIFSVRIDYDGKRANAKDFLKVIMMCVEMMLKDANVQMYGVTFIFDMEGLAMHHFKYASYHFIKYACSCFVNAIPLRIIEAHYVNVPFVFFPILQLVRKCLPIKIRERIQVHKDMTSLHLNTSESLLPLEYLGTAGPLKYFADETKRRVEECNDYFLMDENFGFLEDVEISEIPLSI